MILNQPRPPSAIYNVAYSLSNKSKTVRKGLVRMCSGSVKSANGLNIMFRYFGLPRGNAFWRTCSTFANHVVSIVLRSAKKQMLRVDTRRIVTVMQDKQSVCVANVNEKGNAVRSPSFAITPEATVTGVNKGASPNPTIAGFIDALKKSYNVLRGEVDSLIAVCKSLVRFIHSNVCLGLAVADAYYIGSGDLNLIMKRCGGQAQ